MTNDFQISEWAHLANVLDKKNSQPLLYITIVATYIISLPVACAFPGTKVKMPNKQFNHTYVLTQPHNQTT